METKLRFPLGAPIFVGYDVELEDGAAVYHFPKAEHAECRVYVEQEGGVVSVKERAPVSAKFRRRIEVNGLKNATVRFYGERYCKEEVSVKINVIGDYCENNGELNVELIQSEEYGTYYEVKDVTGDLVFSMPFKDLL